MDFIEGLPRSNGKEVIFIVVDRLNKYAHFISLHHPYMTMDVAQLFIDHIFKLHGMSSAIVSDHDPVFTISFWQGLLKLQGTQLHMSSAYHLQIDGQTEVMNRCLENYLRCAIGD